MNNIIKGLISITPLTMSVFIFKFIWIPQYEIVLSLLLVLVAVITTTLIGYFLKQKS